MMATFLIQKKTKKGSKQTTRKLRLDKYEIDWNISSKSKFQKRVKDFLRPHWENDYVYEECKVAGTRLHFDFYNHSVGVVIECQGKQHEQLVPFFHGEGISGRLKFFEQMKRDDFKNDFCDLNDFLFVQVYETDHLTKSFFLKQGLIL